MLIFDTSVQVGDVFRIASIHTGMTSGKHIKITNLEDARCVSDTGQKYGWSQLWIEDGSLVKENHMGILFQDEEKEEAQVATEPEWGKAQLQELKDVIAAANLSGHMSTLIDCINTRYRTKPYRDLIKSNQFLGHISDQQIRDMKFVLAGIRHNRRTPHAKAFRYEWP